MWDGADWLQKEDCRPNWFKYVGNEWAPGTEAEKQGSMS